MCIDSSRNTQIRVMYHVPGLSGLIAPRVRGVLERQPAVAGLRQRAHHLRVQVACLYLADVLPAGFGSAVGGVKRLAPQVRQFRDDVGVNERPHQVGFHPAHELVRDPVGEVQVVGAAASSPVLSRSSRNSSISAG
jgi:hypothetical protein